MINKAKTILYTKPNGSLNIPAIESAVSGFFYAKPETSPAGINIIA